MGCFWVFCSGTFLGVFLLVWLSCLGWVSWLAWLSLGLGLLGPIDFLGFLGLRFSLGFLGLLGL